MKAGGSSYVQIPASRVFFIARIGTEAHALVYLHADCPVRCCRCANGRSWRIPILRDTCANRTPRPIVTRDAAHTTI